MSPPVSCLCWTTWLLCGSSFHHAQSHEPGKRNNLFGIQCSHPEEVNHIVVDVVTKYWILSSSWCVIQCKDTHFCLGFISVILCYILFKCLKTIEKLQGFNTCQFVPFQPQSNQACGHLLEVTPCHSPFHWVRRCQIIHNCCSINGCANLGFKKALVAFEDVCFCYASVLYFSTYLIL